MKAVIRKIVADLRRRRLQTAVVMIIVLLASATAALGLNLLAGSSDPYQTAFDEQHGAHLTVIYLAAKVSPAQLATTPGLIGATSVAGPWPSISARFEHGSSKFGNLNLFGRSDPGGRVDALRVVAGRWAQAPGDIVLTRSFAQLKRLAIGDQLTAIDTSAKPVYRIVGEVIDIDEPAADFGTQSAWVLPSAIPALLSNEDHVAETMAYRFKTAPTSDQLRQATMRLAAALAPGAIVYALPFTLIKTAFTITNQVILIFLLAFSIFALAAAAAIVGNVVAGAVIASYREIGIMKAVGFTPAQVVGVFIGQMAAPALAGCFIGIPIGALISQLLLAQSASALGLPGQIGFSPLIDLVALVACVLIVAIAAAVPALRAGLMSPVRAITLGTVPNPPASGWLSRLLAALHLPRALSLGGTDAFARPLRSGFTLVAILVGVATLTFAFGLNRSMQGFVDEVFLKSAYQVQITRTAAYPDDAVMATLRSQPETRNVISMTCTSIAIPGVSDPLVCATRGDASTLGIRLRQGRWFKGAGEAVAPAPFLREAHLKVGDSLTVTLQGQPIRARIVGQTIDFENLGHALRIDWSTWQQAFPGDRPYGYLVSLRPGADPNAFAQRVQRTQPDFLSADVNQNPTISAVAIINGVLLVLVAVLVLIAAVGVFNTLLLNSRERVRDTAILKALGMTPRQVLVMVISSAGILGLLGGLLGVPAGIVLFRVLTDAMANLIGADGAFQLLDVFTPPALAALVAAGIAVAILGALAPARWAARTSTAEVLHAE